MALPHLRERTRQVFGIGPNRPIILMYHRVGHATPDPWQLSVTPTHFQDQLEWLAKTRIVLPMRAFIDRHVAGTLPPTATAITFDDGYADNLIEAQPILKHAGLTATLFVVSNAIGRPQSFWWDTLARGILATSSDCDSSFAIAGEVVPIKWRRDQLAAKDWRYDMPPSGPRETAYMAIWRRMQRISEHQRQSALLSLRHILGDENGKSDRAMDSTELEQLAAAGVFAIGGHSATHPALTALSSVDLEYELRESFAFCCSITKGEPVGFAYPYGDVSGPVRAAVIDAGFAWACSTHRSAVRPDDDRYAMPRMCIGNWPAPELARHIVSLTAD